MTANARLRRALTDLAVADAPGPIASGAIAGRARGIRRRRRTHGAAVVVALAVLTGLARPDGDRRSLHVTTDPVPTTSPGPSRTPASAAPASPAPAPPASDPAAPVLPAGPGAKSPAAAPGAVPSGTAAPATSDPALPVDPTATGSPSPTGPRSPKPKPTCHLVTDSTGDEGTTPRYPGLDIASADVASDATVVRAVVRLSSPPTNHPPEGATWRFRWLLGNDTYEFEATRDASGATAARLLVTEQGGTTTTAAATVSLDAQVSQVRWEAPRSAVPDLAAGVTTFHSLRATTSRGTGSTALAADGAESTNTYDDRNPSCLR